MGTTLIENMVPQFNGPDVGTPARVFVPHVDGLRFLAFFSVFLFHSFCTPGTGAEASAVFQTPHQLTRQGNAEGRFFFVLSGLLIAYALLVGTRVLGDNALALVLALGMSWASFNFCEKPFLKLKNRFAFITR